jgi:hypothetical protein
MAEYVTGFQTKGGVKQYDYNALGNKPELLQPEDVTAAVAELGAIQKVSVFGGNFSGTTYVFVSCNIPAGSYTLHIDGIETSDTDSDTCQINFVKNNEVIRANLYQRNSPIDVVIDLSSDIDTVRMYASQGYNESVGDTFTVRGIKILSDTVLNQRLLALENRGAARIGNITLSANKWVGTISPYSQVVTLAGVTENTQVDLTPDVNQLSIFHHKDLAFVTENEDGVVTVYAIGEKPTNDYNIQVTMTEVAV